LRELLAIARDVLGNRREHDVCNRNECCYPTVVQLAEGVLDLEQLVLDLAENLRGQIEYLCVEDDCNMCRETRELLARVDAIGKDTPA
jgi:hypothetical protein